MNRQVEVGFSIGKYEDSVLCDVVPVEACHLLLGRLGSMIGESCMMVSPISSLLCIKITKLLLHHWL